MARIDKKRGSRPCRKNAGKFERFTMLAAKDRHPGTIAALQTPRSLNVRRIAINTSYLRRDAS